MLKQDMTKVSEMVLMTKRCLSLIKEENKDTHRTIADLSKKIKTDLDESADSKFEITNHNFQEYTCMIDKTMLSKKSRFSMNRSLILTTVAMILYAVYRYEWLYVNADYSNCYVAI